MLNAMTGDVCTVSAGRVLSCIEVDEWKMKRKKKDAWGRAYGTVDVEGSFRWWVWRLTCGDRPSHGNGGSVEQRNFSLEKTAATATATMHADAAASGDWLTMGTAVSSYTDTNCPLFFHLSIVASTAQRVPSTICRSTTSWIDSHTWKKQEGSMNG
jgi:hypothetical protein